MEALKILIDNQAEKTIPTQPIRQKTKQILNALGFDRHELSIVITDDAQIRSLNRQYRQKDSATNVLAFSMQEGDFSQITPGLLGDLVISWETADREARSAGITLMERMSQLLVHGSLHLAGFDHEQDESGAREMEEKSLELLRLIETNPNLSIL